MGVLQTPALPLGHVAASRIVASSSGHEGKAPSERIPGVGGAQLLTRVDELVERRPVLAFIQLAIPASEREELRVRAALDNLALFHDEDLIGARDGRQPVGNDKRGASGAKRGEAGLDLLLTLAVKRRTSSARRE